MKRVILTVVLLIFASGCNNSEYTDAMRNNKLLVGQLKDSENKYQDYVTKAEAGIRKANGMVKALLNERKEVDGLIIELRDKIKKLEKDMIFIKSKHNINMANANKAIRAAMGRSTSSEKEVESLKKKLDKSNTKCIELQEMVSELKKRQTDKTDTK